MNNILELGFQAQAKSLRDFGYGDVTDEMVRSAHKKWVSRQPMTGVIEMFCEGAFERHPDIFGKPKA